MGDSLSLPIPAEEMQCLSHAVSGNLCQSPEQSPGAYFQAGLPYLQILPIKPKPKK